MPDGRPCQRGPLMRVEVHGTPNWQRFAETWAAIIAAKEGLEVVPGSVRVELKEAAPWQTERRISESDGAD